MRPLFYTTLILILFNCSFTLAQVNTFLNTYISGYSSSVIQDMNGDYLIIGNSTIPVSGGPTGMRLIKIKHLGDTLWTKLYGNVYQHTSGTKIIETVDGNYIACGIASTPVPHSSIPELMLTKLDANGDTLWWNTYGGTYGVYEAVNDLLLNNNSLYVVGRNTDSGLFLKTDEVGKIIFKKKYSFGSGESEFKSIKNIDDNNFFLFGFVSKITSDNSIYSKYLLFRTNLNGDSLSSVYFGEDSSEVYPFSLIKTIDGNYIVSGYSQNLSHSPSLPKDYTMISKFDKEGNMIWKKKFEFYGGEIVSTSDSGIVFYSTSIYNYPKRITLTKLKNDSSEIWSRDIFFPDSSGISDLNCTGIAETNDGGLIITGYVSYNSEPAEIFLLKTNSEGLLTRINIENTSHESFVLTHNYPNPFNPSTKISYSVPKSNLVTIKVYDALGEEIATLVNEEKSIGTYEVEFNGRNLSSGVYFYRIQAGSFIDTKKFILIK